MIRSFFFLLLSLVPLVSIFVLQEPKPIDLYKLLKVDKNASQRDISKAFHKLSLKYHLDRNKAKDAQEKFSLIKNAYEILSDKDKRKNYDLYGDDKSSPNLDGGSYGDCGGCGQGYSKSSFSSSGTIKAINSEFCKKYISEKGMTWLLLVYFPFVKEYDILESIVEEVTNSLQGAIEVGSMNCQNELTFFKDLGIAPSRIPGLFIYSYKTTERGSLVEYNGEWDGKSLKNFCQDQLPRVSRRIDFLQFVTNENLPQVLLLSAKKDTPVLWRVLSGLYHNRFLFFDAEVHDVSDPVLRKLGVDTLPAVIGRLSNGEMHVLRAGSVKKLKTGISELRAVLDAFEKNNKKAASGQANRPSHVGSQHAYRIPLLTGSNFESMCNDSVVVCIIAIFRSSITMETLEYIRLNSMLYQLSKKTLAGQQNQLYNSRDAISYSLLDSSKHTTFLYAFSSSGFRYSAMLIVAYKPREETFAILKDDLRFMGVQEFISSVLVGDIRFNKVRQKPIIE